LELSTPHIAAPILFLVCVLILNAAYGCGISFIRSVLIVNAEYGCGIFSFVGDERFGCLI